jgi:hypothetical protein
LSTIEVEYMETTHASKEVVWLHRLCSGIGFENYHSRMKHIDVQYHFMRDMVERKKVLLEKVDTLENIADSLTKFVSVVKFLLV